MAKVYLIGTGVGEQSGQVPVADGNGGYAWSPVSGAGGGTGLLLDTTATDIQMDGVQAAGSIGKAADAGHRHPTDTTRAPLASPTFTGVPSAPTPATADNSTKLATTAYADRAVQGVSLSSLLHVIVDTPEQHNAKRDGKLLVDATITAGALGTLNSASAPFVPGNVGMTVMIPLAGTQGAQNYLITTIATYVSATQVTLTTPAARATTNQLAVYGTDDTAAIKAAAANVVSLAQAANQYYAEVQFSAGIYIVAGALDTSQNGNAQIPIPYQTPTGMKFTLVFKGTADNSGLTHWLQTEPQMTGAVLVSAAMPAYSATFGTASVIGGPTSEQGFGNGNNGTFSNMLFVVDGITVTLPFDHTQNGVDLFGMAEANIPNLGAFAFGTVVGGYWWPNFTPANFLYSGNYVPCGLVMPNAGNNDNSNIGLYSSEGLTGGIALGEHTHADSIRVLNSWWGLTFTVLSNGGNPNAINDHSMDIGYLSTEMCRSHIYMPPASSPQVLNIGNWDPEDTGNAVVHIADGDPGLLRGDIKVNLQMVQQAPIIHGGARVVDTSSAPGSRTPPTVTTGAYSPPLLYRDATYYVSGGTVSSITVDGATVGLTAGAIRVPSRKRLVINNTVAPTITALILE